MLDQQRDYVLRSVEERGVRLVRLWFTDVLGNLKSLAISPAELENALEDGMTFDGSSIDGFSRVQEADVLAMPDPDTVELLPNKRVRFRTRFLDYTGQFVFHCHILEHEDMGMMRNFRIT